MGAVLSGLVLLWSFHARPPAALTDPAPIRRYPRGTKHTPRVTKAPPPMWKGYPHAMHPRAQYTDMGEAARQALPGGTGKERPLLDMRGAHRLPAPPRLARSVGTRSRYQSARPPRSRRGRDEHQKFTRKLQQATRQERRYRAGRSSAAVVTRARRETTSESARKAQKVI